MFLILVCLKRAFFKKMEDGHVYSQINSTKPFKPIFRGVILSSSCAGGGGGGGLLATPIENQFPF